MRVKLNWLKELVDLNGISLPFIADTIGQKSAEVEKTDYMLFADSLVVGKVIAKTPHPNSDHLHLLRVDVKDEVLDIVCGAGNVAAGQKVLVAKVGCKLKQGEIRPAKIRGQQSKGMVCSLEELGLDAKFVEEEYKGGIFYFKDTDEVEIGTEGKEALNLADPVLELDVTANRGDLLSMLGVARECSALFKRPLTFNMMQPARTYDEMLPDVKIKIESDLCTAYYGQIIRNVELRPSPIWLKSRLIAFGIRPINSFVDVTNYIMALFNQPLHAFDLDKIGSDITVSQATEREEFVTLDDKIRILQASDLTIRSNNVPVALAGVMGGKESEVTDATKNIFLEAAIFDPLTIRKTAQRLNLHSEASYRFERGVDVNQTKAALDYACYLYQTLCGADIVNDPSFAGTPYIEDKLIPLKVCDVNGLLGTRIKKQEITDILKSLQFKVTPDLKVYVPNRRFDIQIKEDLIEEVARIYGYNKLKETLPVDNHCGGYTLAQKRLNTVKKTMVALGMSSVVTYTLTDDEANMHFAFNRSDDDVAIKVLSPLTEERKTIRQGLIPSLLSVCKYNFSRKEKDIRIFEVSKIYSRSASKIKERTFLAGLMTNTVSSCLHRGRAETVDFYYGKGIIEAMARMLDVTLTFKRYDLPTNDLHPARSAVIQFENQDIGFIGELHPQYGKDLKGVIVFEIVLDKIVNRPFAYKRYTQIEKLPKIERDIALVMKKTVPAADVISCIKDVKEETLKKIDIFDLYEGEQLQEDEKSLALKLTFISDMPLTEDDIAGKMNAVLKALKEKLNIELRK